MARKTNRPETVRNYRYGCLKPEYGLEEIVNQLRLANEQWNKYVDLIYWESREWQKIYSQAPRYKTIKRRIQTIKAGIKAKDVSLRALNSRIGYAKHRGKDHSALDAEKARLVKRKKQLYGTLDKLWELEKALRSKLKTLYKADFEQLNEEVNRKKRGVYASNELYWGTKVDLQRRHDQARGALLRGGRPRSRSFDGTGSLAFRFQRAVDGTQGQPVSATFSFSPEALREAVGRMTAAKEGEADYRRWVEAATKSKAIPHQLGVAGVHIGALPEPKGEKLTDKEKRTYVAFVIQTIGGKPVWALVPMLYHRPLPDNGSIKEVKLVRERQGVQWKYWIIFSVAEEESLPAQPSLPAVGIDVGWRDLGHLRVGVIASPNGHIEEIVLNPAVRWHVERSREIKAVWDMKFEEIKKKVSDWLEAHPVPAWVTEETARLASFRSHSRLHRLYARLRESLKAEPNDDLQSLVDLLAPWIRKDRHLYDWWVNLERKGRAIRNDQYRKLAAQLASENGAIYMEGMRLTFATTKAGPEAVDHGEAYRYNRALAAPSILKIAIENACTRRDASGRERTHFSVVPARYTSQQCSVCGRKTDIEKAVEWTCPHCGTAHDRDENAAINVVRKGLGLGPLAGTAQKRRRKRAWSTGPNNGIPTP